MPTYEQKEIIGIAGGLGPFAHIDFERKLLESAQKLIGASEDQDFPEWILSSVPQTPDRTLSIRGEAPDSAPWLIRSLKRLERGGPGDENDAPGADFAVIPCNTAHHFLPRLREAVSIPIFDMIEVTARHIRALGEGACVGILATTGTLESRLYHRALASEGLEAVSPLDLPDGAKAQRRFVMEPIYGPFAGGRHVGGGIKAVGKRQESAALLTEGARMLIDTLGAQVIVAGCTEIPIALEGDRVGEAIMVDPNRVLAETAIRRAYGLDEGG